MVFIELYFVDYGFLIFDYFLLMNLEDVTLVLMLRTIVLGVLIVVIHKVDED